MFAAQWRAAAAISGGAPLAATKRSGSAWPAGKRSTCALASARISRIAARSEIRS